MNISQRILDTMHKKNVSQKEMAEHIGVSTSAVSDWKKKGTTPSADKIAAIADCLGVSVCYLLGVTECSDCSFKCADAQVEVEKQVTFNDYEIARAYLALATRDKLEVQLDILKRSQDQNGEEEK